MPLRVNMWSSPRNLSTAMMYSWRQRSDTTVFDEPLYAHCLRSTGDTRHPGYEEVLASQNTDGDAVVRDIMLADHGTPVVFFKQMAKHIVDVDRAFLPRFKNVLLTRAPHEMLTSLQVQLPDATIHDTGFPEMIQILDALLAAGEEPIVIETRTLLADPRAVLTELCARLGLEFDAAMLAWPAGPKPEDGVWAKHWYHAVHQSTGWRPFEPKDVELLPAVAPALAEAEAMYKRLLPFRIGG